MFALRFCLLFVTWCAFSGFFDPFHLSLGAMASAWVAAVSNHIALAQPHKDRPTRGMKFVAGLTSYIAWLIIQVIKANIQVLKLSFASSVEHELSPRVVEFRTSLPDDFSRFVLAQSITLTPGTITIRVDGDRFIVHALTEDMAMGVPGDMETRLLALFGARTVVEHPGADSEPADVSKVDTSTDGVEVESDAEEEAQEEPESAESSDDSEAKDDV
jgi:multicomponent Na+:H+ antiporter subunit E